MIRALEWVWTADAYEGSALKYLGNQIGHFGIGVVLVWLGLPPLAAIALYALAIEAVQISRGGPVWDSIQDTAFVACGALLAPVALLFLASGVVRRIA